VLRVDDRELALVLDVHEHETLRVLDGELGRPDLDRLPTSSDFASTQVIVRLVVHGPDLAGRRRTGLRQGRRLERLEVEHDELVPPGGRETIQVRHDRGPVRSSMPSTFVFVSTTSSMRDVQAAGRGIDGRSPRNLAGERPPSPHQRRRFRQVSPHSPVPPNRGCRRRLVHGRGDGDQDGDRDSSGDHGRTFARRAFYQTNRKR
jgi:hypothetical protein